MRRLLERKPVNPMWSPQAVIERLASSSLLPEHMFDALDADALLEARGDSFDDEWIRAAEAVQAAWESFPEADDHAGSIDQVRETAFKHIFDGTGGHHDLAATVSDDFEVICKRALLGIELPFITKLEAAYEAQQVPH